MRLRFTKRASQQIDAALGFIAKESPQGADRLRDRIQATALLISQQPRVGHATTQNGVRRVVVLPYPFVMFYRIRDDEVVIQRLFHTSRNPERAPSPL